MANRLLELGCVDAINLDGGGSTAISGIYPGCDSSQILNSPSDVKLRPCANYIFLKNNKKPDSEFNKVFFYPFEQHYLSGYSEKIDVKAVDGGYYKTELPVNIEYLIHNNTSTYQDGILTANGSGGFEITAEIDGEKVGSANYYKYRFSPGYGGLDISSQADFFKLLPMTKQMGVSLSESFLMTPTKTVTAFIGVTKER